MKELLRKHLTIVMNCSDCVANHLHRSKMEMEQFCCATDVDEKTPLN